MRSAYKDYYATWNATTNQQEDYEQSSSIEGFRMASDLLHQDRLPYPKAPLAPVYIVKPP